MFDHELAVEEQLAHEMVVNGDVFGAGTDLRVLDQGQGSLIVDHKLVSPTSLMSGGNGQFTDGKFAPDEMSCSVRRRHIPSLHSAFCHTALSFG